MVMIKSMMIVIMMVGYLHDDDVAREEGGDESGVGLVERIVEGTQAEHDA
jgi:hypothetical protein